MASFAVSGATLGVVRAASSARSGADRKGGVDSPSLLFRKKDSSRTPLSISPQIPSAIFSPSSLSARLACSVLD
jgi:hypothetical protein